MASVALLWAEHHLRVLHPLALLFIVLLVITSAAAIGSLVRGLWRLWRGPRRLAAVGWMSLAILPALLWPGLGWYGFYKWHRREISHQLPFTLAAMAGASLMEAQARYLYPHRLESARLVMFYRDDLADPRGDLEAMDRHVGRMEKLTGLVHRQKIWWVRGPLLGEHGLSMYGLAIGSTQSPASGLDRHELAHAVFYQHAYPETDASTFLMEGWAESQTNDRQVLASRAWATREMFTDWGHRWGQMSDDERKVFLSTLVDPGGWETLMARCTEDGGIHSWLRELTNPYWYHRDKGPVYSMGGAFVDFLIRRYGAQRFVELCFAVRPGRFESVCQNVYGLDVDTLEKQFWNDVAQTAASAKHAEPKRE